MKATHENVQYMRIGLALVGIVVSDQSSELIIEIFEGIKKKKGKFNIGDALEIQVEVKAKYDRMNRPRPKVSIEKNKKP